MTINYDAVWDGYVASWNTETLSEKRELFNQNLDSEFIYQDPQINFQGWDGLEAYMMNFHQQMPGTHFVTTYFMAHHDKSIARWDLRTAEDQLVMEGISYGEYNSDGKLAVLTVFFEPPQA